jgi:ABC transport system ATP-binding/permease protein
MAIILIIKKPVLKETPVVSAPKSEKKKLSFKEKQELDSLPEEINKLEGEKVKLSEELNSGITDHTRLQQLATDIKAITERIEEKTLRWLELTELESNL